MCGYRTLFNFVMDNIKKTIYCPRCGRRITDYRFDDLKSEPAKCKKCNVMVVYDLKTDMTITFPVPERKTSSGMRFY